MPIGYIVAVNRVAQIELDSRLKEAARRFADSAAGRLPVRAAMVFGSRARGDARPDSDLDVAILLSGPHRPFLATKLELTDLAYDVLLATGVYIQALPLWEDEWDHPERHRNRSLVENIRRDGILL